MCDLETKITQDVDFMDLIKNSKSLNRRFHQRENQNGPLWATYQLLNWA